LFTDEKIKEIDDKIKQIKTNKNTHLINKENLNSHSQSIQGGENLESNSK